MQCVVSLPGPGRRSLGGGAALGRAGRVRARHSWPTSARPHLPSPRAHYPRGESSFPPPSLHRTLPKHQSLAQWRPGNRATEGLLTPASTSHTCLLISFRQLPASLPYSACTRRHQHLTCSNLLSHLPPLPNTPSVRPHSPPSLSNPTKLPPPPNTAASPIKPSLNTTTSKLPLHHQNHHPVTHTVRHISTTTTAHPHHHSHHHVKRIASTLTTTTTTTYNLHQNTTQRHPLNSTTDQRKTTTTTTHAPFRNAQSSIPRQPLQEAQIIP